MGRRATIFQSVKLRYCKTVRFLMSRTLWAFLSVIFVRLQPSHKSADGCWPVGAGFTAGRTLWLANSTGDMGHKGERVETLLGTRSEPANLAAIHRGHKPLPTCCCTQLHNRQRPKLVRRELQRMPQSKQSGSSRLLFGSMQGKIRAAHIVPRLLARANTRAVVSAEGHHGRQGTLRAERRTDRQSPWSDSGTSLEAGACAKTSEPNYKHGRWYTNRMRSLASYKWWRQGRAPQEH